MILKAIHPDRSNKAKLQQKVLRPTHDSQALAMFYMNHQLCSSLLQIRCSASLVLCKLFLFILFFLKSIQTCLQLYSLGYKIARAHTHTSLHTTLSPHERGKSLPQRVPKWKFKAKQYCPSFWKGGESSQVQIRRCTEIGSQQRSCKSTKYQLHASGTPAETELSPLTICRGSVSERRH